MVVVLEKQARGKRRSLVVVFLAIPRRTSDKSVADAVVNADDLVGRLDVLGDQFDATAGWAVLEGPEEEERRQGREKKKR